jgi:hypothetical protein
VRPSFLECDVAKGVIASRAGMAALAARATPVLRHAANGKAVAATSRQLARTGCRDVAASSFRIRLRRRWLCGRRLLRTDGRI